MLAILEISLSFDNAVVNAMKLENMSEKWRHRFITWGILIAVFGMRFVFPILVVAIFAKLGMVEVAKMALTNVDEYAHYLHMTHAPIVTFGGMFLILRTFSIRFLSFPMRRSRQSRQQKSVHSVFLTRVSLRLRVMQLNSAN